MKKFLAIILTFVLCFGVLSVALAAEDEPATAVPDGYIGIYTAEDLNNVRNNLSGKYILMNNIDLSSYENWSPIGTSETPFTGELDGNGYVIKNMKIHKEFTDGEEPCLGLFSSINSAEIINLLLLGVDIKASFAGEAPGSFGIGSVSGYAKGATFESCITSGAITIDGFNEGFAGGISGTGISSELTNCVNNTKINLLSENVYDICIGGIFGRGTRTTISHSVNSGDITVRGIDYDKKGRMLKIGGLAADFGNFHLVLNDCYNKGNISLDFSIPSAYVGGIMGNGFLIKQCYNSGKITVPETFSGYAGGLSGNFPEGWLASVPSPNIINSYYNNKDFYPTYIGEESSPSDDYFTNVKYLTPEEMKSQESFVGFDFDTVWEMEENGYPILRNMPVIPETEKPGVTKPTTTTEPKTTKPDAAVPDGYIGIYTAEDLDNIRNNLSGKYILMNNIDLSSYENWSPIGTSETPFTGELDGNGYSVENMTITAVQEEQLNAGLFGYTKNATVKNLTIDKGKIDVSADKGVNAGLVCAEAEGSVILNCKTYGSVDAKSGGCIYTGGMAGRIFKSDYKESFVKCCANYADVNAIGCYVEALYFNSFTVGGIVGLSLGNIYECSNHGNITATETKGEEDTYKMVSVGGISGWQAANLIDCYNTGDIGSTGLASTVAAGGITGNRLSHYKFSCVYNTGDVNAVNTSSKEYRRGYYGAIAGLEDSIAYIPETPKEDMLPFVYAEYCYYSDNVDKPFEYFDEENEPTIKMLSTEEFKHAENFTGFDFENIWVMDEKLGRPVLANKSKDVIPTSPSTEAVVTTTKNHTDTTTTTVQNDEPSTEEESTTQPVTEIEPTTISVTEPSTTQPITEKEPTAEPSTTTTTEPSAVTTTEPSTELSTESDEDIGILEWLIKVIKMTIDWFVKLFVMLGC